MASTQRIDRASTIGVQPYARGTRPGLPPSVPTMPVASPLNGGYQGLARSRSTGEDNLGIQESFGYELSPTQAPVSRSTTFPPSHIEPFQHQVTRGSQPQVAETARPAVGQTIRLGEISVPENRPGPCQDLGGTGKQNLLGIDVGEMEETNATPSYNYENAYTPRTAAYLDDTIRGGETATQKPEFYQNQGYTMMPGKSQSRNGWSGVTLSSSNSQSSSAPVLAKPVGSMPGGVVLNRAMSGAAPAAGVPMRRVPSTVAPLSPVQRGVPGYMAPLSPTGVPSSGVPRSTAPLSPVRSRVPYNEMSRGQEGYDVRYPSDATQTPQPRFQQLGAPPNQNPNHDMEDQFSDLYQESLAADDDATPLPKGVSRLARKERSSSFDSDGGKVLMGECFEEGEPQPEPPYKGEESTAIRRVRDRRTQQGVSGAPPLFQRQKSLGRQGDVVQGDVYQRSSMIERAGNGMGEVEQGGVYQRNTTIGREQSLQAGRQDGVVPGGRTLGREMSAPVEYHPAVFQRHMTLGREGPPETQYDPTLFPRHSTLGREGPSVAHYDPASLPRHSTLGRDLPPGLQEYSSAHPFPGHSARHHQLAQFEQQRMSSMASLGPQNVSVDPRTGQARGTAVHPGIQVGYLDGAQGIPGWGPAGGAVTALGGPPVTSIRPSGNAYHQPAQGMPVGAPFQGWQQPGGQPMVVGRPMEASVGYGEGMGELRGQEGRARSVGRGRQGTLPRVEEGERSRKVGNSTIQREASRKVPVKGVGKGGAERAKKEGQGKKRVVKKEKEKEVEKDKKIEMKEKLIKLINSKEMQLKGEAKLGKEGDGGAGDVNGGVLPAEDLRELGSSSMPHARSSAPKTEVRRKVVSERQARPREGVPRRVSKEGSGVLEREEEPSMKSFARQESRLLSNGAVPVTGYSQASMGSIGAEGVTGHPGGVPQELGLGSTNTRAPENATQGLPVAGLNQDVMTRNFTMQASGQAKGAQEIEEIGVAVPGIGENEGTPRAAPVPSEKRRVSFSTSIRIIPSQANLKRTQKIEQNQPQEATRSILVKNSAEDGLTQMSMARGSRQNLGEGGAAANNQDELLGRKDPIESSVAQRSGATSRFYNAEVLKTTKKGDGFAAKIPFLSRRKSMLGGGEM